MFHRMERNVATYKDLNFGQLLGALNTTQRELIRQIENNQKKLNNGEVALAFNLVCLKENILPGYTNIKLHDEDARNSHITHKFRTELVKRQIQDKREVITQLKKTVQEQKRKWDKADVIQDLRQAIEDKLKKLNAQHRKGVEARNISKLARLYGGNIKLPQPRTAFINLVPGLELTDDQEELLNLGLNCHFMTKPRPHRKRLELEILLDDIKNLEKAKKVTTSDNLTANILAEAGKTRGSFQSQILQKRHFVAAKQLREKEDIIIRRTDKTAAIAIVTREEYLAKMDTILQDTSKFKNITRNPTENIKKEINATISTINGIQSAPKFTKLTGEFSPGYAYGNVKNHKPGNPLRPIISQIPTATYNIAKKLNEILTPYVPTDYTLTSSNEFLELLKDSPEADDHIIASLDVESLFTNVPVDRTIEFILDRVYRCQETPTLNIPEEKLKTLLEICTKQAPFTCPRGKMYCQIDGVAMGSPLGVLFANFFMGTIEATVLQQNRPSIYCRYIDDIFVRVRNLEELQALKKRLTDASSLNFTYEESRDGSLPFLDVLVTARRAGFTTTVYVKETNQGLCLNGDSECPQRYIRSTINAYVRRALSHCTSWESTNKELERLTQVLINNGYKNSDIQEAIKTAINKKHTNEQQHHENQEKIKIFYKSHMSTQHRIEEKAIRDIIHRNVKPTNPNQAIDLVIYYKTRKTSQLIMKNKTTRKPAPTQEANVIYQHICTAEDCGPHSYVGMTRTTLSRRLTCHLQNGSIKEHYYGKHQTKLTRQQLEEKTTIIDRETDARRLLFLEALYIESMKPAINQQTRDLQILPTRKRGTQGMETNSSR